MAKQPEMTLEFLFREVLDSVPDSFGILNSDRNVVYCNDTFASTFGVSKEEAIGKNHKELLEIAWNSNSGVNIEADDFSTWFDELIKTQQSTPISHFESDMKDGRWYKMTRINLKNGYMLIFGVDITDLKNTQKSLEEANQRIEHLANTDQLTGVNNRRAFDLLSVQEIERAMRYRQPMSLLALDIDFFKSINDNYGHEGGDDVLREFARLCGTLLRQSDSLCRIGGEEFAVLLPMSDIAAAHSIAERIRSHVERHAFPLIHLNQTINITVSVGISYLIDTDRDIKELLARADSALYQAKGNGRNQVIEFSPF